MRIVFEGNEYVLTKNNIYKNGVQKRITKESNYSKALVKIIDANDLKGAILLVKRIIKNSYFPSKEFKCIICKVHLKPNGFVCKNHKKLFNRYYFDGKKKMPIISV